MEDDKDFDPHAAFVYYIQQIVNNKYICKKTPPPCPHRGEENYYVWRFNNFMERHVDCSHEPPVYYYGPLETKAEINLFVKNIENKDYILTPPILISPAVSLLINVVNAKIMAENISKAREIWIKLEPELAKRQKSVPATHRDTIPNISKSYGYKYCVAFGKLLPPELTPQGKKWAKDTLLNLQNYMEMGLVKLNWIARMNTDFNQKYKLDQEKYRTEFYTDIEIDNAKFKEFAFATHPDAYLDAGLEKLPISDLIKIMVTPDFAEWADWSTWEQAVLVAPDVIGQKAEDAYDWVKDTAKDMYKKATDWFD